MTDEHISPFALFAPWRDMGADDLAAWGINDVAYVKPIIVDGASAYAIHSADGQPLDVIDGRDAAFAAALVNDLMPLSVH